MSTNQVPLRFFRRDELQPPAGIGRPIRPEVELLAPVEHDDIANLAKELCHQAEAVILASEWSSKPHIRAFVAVLYALGAVTVAAQGESVGIKPRGRLATHLPEIFEIYIANGFTLFDGWHRTATLPEDGVGAINLIHQAELRRIELSKRVGIFPRALDVRPSAFVIFRALSKTGENCYLFELNKDWQRLNLIGGKQEGDDDGDFARTAKREVPEELGIAASRLSLSRLNNEPIDGYFLSGIGILTSYPCVLFGAIVTGSLPTRRFKDRWITEEQIREAVRYEQSSIMVNPQYMSYLLEGTPSRLVQCPLSTTERVKIYSDSTLPIASESARSYKLTEWIKHNKELTAAMLTILAALLTVLVTIL